MATGPTPSKADPPRLGRPRDVTLTERLLSGTLTLVAERGLDPFTADALVAATGAGKAAIYRRWPNTDALVVEAVRSCRPVPPAVDTGSAHEDLVALLDPFTRGLDRDERALAAVLGHARHSPALRAALNLVVVAPLAAAVTALVGRHVIRGHGVTAEQDSLLHRLVLALWWERWTTDPLPRTADELGILIDRVLLPVISTR